MRDRVIEFIPLLLVGVVLVAFQLTRGNSPALQFQVLPEVTPTPVVNVVFAQPAPRQRTSPIIQVGACNAAQPHFIGGIAALKAVLGSSMGEPVECERATSPQGDTQQKTTTGLAYYRKHLNLACFTTGWDHWALVNDGLVHWTGEAVDPPVEAVVAH